MPHNREWMYRRLEGKYIADEFADGVKAFVKFACDQPSFKEYPFLKCPCDKCWNRDFREPDEVKLHLYQFGFRPNYYQWEFHGEPYHYQVGALGESSSSGPPLNPYRDMIIDAFGPGVENYVHNEGSHEFEMPDTHGDGEEPFPAVKEFFDMLKASEQPLYEGCDQSLLSATSRLLNLKCEHNISHRAIDGFTALMKDVLPDGNLMVDTYYRTRQLLKGLLLPHHYIHVCPNGCMLFWKEKAHLSECDKCLSPRYKKSVRGRNIPRKVLIYFPITPRLQRLYALKNIAEQMTWHARNKHTNGEMAHPCDGEAWQKFDEDFPDFAEEPRNVRVGLCTDGFSPFGKCGGAYSCWPVILTPYNLPPWLCMKRPFMFLSLLIPGPKSPKGNIDIYLQPLVDELKELWEVGALTYDISKRQNFTMKAALMWTINDFPAYGMLSGWSTAGKLACPYCMENTKSFTLKHGRKQTWFDCHRQFLSPDHVFRRDKKGFLRNREEHSSPPPRLSGDEIWEIVSQLPKSVDDQGGCQLHDNWKKQSVFWELPYWRKLLVRHNLDVMHIEKNFFDQILNTVMGVQGKTKDDVAARKDIALYCNRPHLQLKEVQSANGSVRQVFPEAPYVLNKDERKVPCQWVKDLKFPYGYASNLDAAHSRAVRRAYGQTAAKSLRNIAYKVAKVYKRENTNWVSSDTRKKLLARREDPNFKKRSAQASLNKLTGPKGRTLHAQGSISTAQVARKLAKDKGKMPTASDLFLHTHQRKKDSSFIDDRARKTYDAYQTRKQANPTLPDDQVFLEACGGWNRKGTVYGLGSGARIFYDRPSSSSAGAPTHASGSSYQPSIVVQLQGELEHTRKQLDDQRNIILQMQSQFNSMSQHLRALNSGEMPDTPNFEELCSNAASRLPHHGGGPPDPGTGGGPGFTACS